MKSILKKVAGIALAAVFVFGMMGCKHDVDTHEHTFATTYTSNETHHWYAATCEHTAEVKDSGEHSFGEWKVSTPATEKAEGTKERECSECGYKETETIAKLEHVHAKGTLHEAVAGTCKTKGTVEYYDCAKSTCEVKLNADGNPLASIEGELDPANHEGTGIWTKTVSTHKETYDCCEAVKTAEAAHSFGEWKVSTPATEETEGVKERECSECHYKVTETIAKLKHTHKFATTYTSNETHHWYAATCEHTTEVKDKAEHNFGEWTIEHPSEDAEGKIERKCSDCQYLAEEIIAKLEHVHAKGTHHEAVASTCKTKGIVEYYDCAKSTCVTKLDAEGNPLASTESELDPSNHEGIATTFEAVDAENHKEKYKCCNAVKTEPHNWNNGEVTKAPSTTEEGVKTYTCTAEGCGWTKTEVIAKVPIPDGNVAKANLIINGTEIAKTSEISVIPAGTFATIEMTDDSAWSGFVSSSAGDWYKGVFLKNRKVKLSPFVMGQYPVTRDLYKAVMGSDPSIATSHETQGENPVNYVNWFNAIIFCNKLSALEGLEPVYSYNFSGTDETDPDKWISDTTNLGAVPTSNSSTNYSNWKGKVKIDITKNGYRLPTEAEWEFAARGGDPAKADWKYAFSGINVYGSNMVHNGTTYLKTDSNLATVGWYTDNSSSGTHGVGLKKANALNLYDMSGNVWQWCNDFYNSTATTNDSAYTKDGYVTDPLGAASGSRRCLRGGSWNSDAGYCAVSNRYFNDPYGRGGVYGFRVCRSAN